MNSKNAFRNWLIISAATMIVVVVCIVYIDRPIAEFFEKRVAHTGIWVWTARALAPIDAAVVAALLFLLACGAWVLSARPLPQWTRIPLLCSWAAMWATAADIIFKRAFGRAWPYPTYIENHLYGFHLLHGGPYWESFPSGTAAISSAIASVLWLLTPRWRFLSVSIVVLLSFAVVMNNYHWVGDVVAGAFLGSSIGWMTVRLDAASSDVSTKSASASRPC
jgi:membrane-associated phospholipid phosphatase